jgi:hypothetical protein
MYLRFEAIDPATGAAVTGVTVSDVAVYGVIIETSEVVFIETGQPRLIPGPSG